MMTKQSNGHKTASAAKKKVLLMGHADGLGGAQTAFRKLYDFARDEGHEVKVVCVSDGKKHEQYFAHEATLGCIAHTGSALSLPLKKTTGLLNAAIHAKKFRPDIFVGVGLNNSTNLVARFAGKACFKIGHDFIAGRPYNDLIWVKSKTVLNGIALQAPSMLTYWHTAGTHEKAINWLPCFPEPPVNGILQKGKADESNIRIAYFGRLAGNKGLPLLVRALASPGVSPNVTLHLWGKGAEEEVLKSLVAELELGSRVQFCGGYPEGEEGARLMASYNAMVLCSTGTEGLPLILLEAMAYGLPFLATDVGAIRDCCHNNPDTILVQPTQEEITAGLRLLIGRIKGGDFNPQRLRRFYEENFSYAIMSARWRACFQNPQNFFNGRE